MAIPADALPQTSVAIITPASAAGPTMSPEMANSNTIEITAASNKRKPWIGYVASLMFTLFGIVMLLWACHAGVMMMVEVPQPAAEVSIATVILEGVAGALTTVFGFAMLVQNTPSIDVETASAWTLPEQRTFDDEALLHQETQ